MVEAARALAVQAMKSSSRFEKRADAVALGLLSRRLTADERPIVRRTLDRALESYRGNAEGAKKLIHVGHSRPDPSLAPEELAAWTLVASQVMNLDEALTK